MKRGCVAAVLVCLLASAVAAAPAVARRAAGVRTSCFWSQEGASRFGIGADYAFPDSGAVYWTAQITMPPGSHIVFRGRFAHARYQSLNAYDAATHAPVDGLDDVDTAPDHGSVNPYRSGPTAPRPGARTRSGCTTRRTRPATPCMPASAGRRGRT